MAKRKRATPKTKTAVDLVPEQVDRSILVIRGQKVLLDSQLAGFYGVETRVLVQGVKRNSQRFPPDFMFQLTDEEWNALRSQLVILKGGRGQHRKYLPYAFTEQGVAMLSSVLRSPRAAEVNVQIMRAFVRLRQLLSVHKELAERLVKLEQQMTRRDAAVDAQFREIFSLLERLFNPPTPPRKPIGFHVTEKPANVRKCCAWRLPNHQGQRRTRLHRSSSRCPLLLVPRPGWERARVRNRAGARLLYRSPSLLLFPRLPLSGRVPFGCSSAHPPCRK